MNSLERQKSDSQTKQQTGIQWEYAALTDELRKQHLSQHHPSVADKEAQKNLEIKAINIGINENLEFGFNRT